MEIVDKYREENKEQVDLWTPKKEDHEVLIKLIEKFDLKSFFEIGTYKAFTTKLLISHPNITNWKSIDIHSHWDDLIYTTVVDSGEYKVSEGEQYDLIFIDGDHENAKRDTELALKMKPKVIAWHDYSSQELVKKDVDLYKPINVEANIAWKRV